MFTPCVAIFGCLCPFRRKLPVLFFTSHYKAATTLQSGISLQSMFTVYNYGCSELVIALNAQHTAQNGTLPSLYVMIIVQLLNRIPFFEDVHIPYVRKNGCNESETVTLQKS